MSTYYAIVCDKHMEQTSAASHSAGGYGPLMDGPSTLFPFIACHHGCPVRIVSEHEDDWCDDERFVEWTKENCQEMIDKSLARSDYSGEIMKADLEIDDLIRNGLKDAIAKGFQSKEA